jgi:cytochrome c oxidase subunit 3
LIRTEIITADNKTILSRAESEQRLSRFSFVVEGANPRNEYGSKLFVDFFYYWFHGLLSGVIINIIIFFNVLLGTYEKEKVMRW